MTTIHDVVVIGAGPGGLATAAMLQGRGLDVLLLERGDGVGHKWRQSYDALRINTSAWFSYLPGMRIRSSGQWPHRDELVAYYERYATHFGLEVELGCEVQRLERSGTGWTIQTNRGERGAHAVVVATAKDHTPVMPDWPGLATYTGEVLHSARYRNAAP